MRRTVVENLCRLGLCLAVAATLLSGPTLADGPLASDDRYGGAFDRYGEVTDDAATVAGTATVDDEQPAEAPAEIPAEAAAEQPAQVPTPAVRPETVDEPAEEQPAEVPTPPASASDIAEEEPAEAATETETVAEEETAAEAAPAADATSTEETSQKPLVPIPDPLDAGPVAIETATFDGVTPGESTVEDVEKAWGAPKEIGKQGGLQVHLHSVEPFNQVEVSYFKDKVASILIRFEQPFPADTVAEQLELTNVRPVLVSNELGEILGQVYPERGVLFAFQPAGEPGKATMRVAQIVLEPISSEPFVLRAETVLETSCRLALQDLDQALKVQPSNARAHWLRAKSLLTMGRYDDAAKAATESVRLDPSNPRYRVTRAEILGQTGKIVEAIREAQRAADISKQLPHVETRAICLLGDLLASGAQPDYKRAIQYHTEAARAADQLATNRHPAIRLAAKKVLVDAYLGAAHDIAWGEWKEKDVAVVAWLEQANAAAESLIEDEGASQQHRFHVATRALAACVGLRASIDPQKWTEKALETGEQLILAADDKDLKTRLQWDLGIALYDSMQIYQMRGDQDTALKCGQLAARFLQHGHKDNPTASSKYLLGRLQFRLGAIYAIGKEDHEAAVEYFDRALTLLGDAVPAESIGELGRHGETFVSMGVSYWSAGQRDKAVELTERGVVIMEEAAKKGLIKASSLSVPYGNLASMHRVLGAEDKATQFERMANSSDGGNLK